MSDIHGVNVDGTAYGLNDESLEDKVEEIEGYIDAHLQVATMEAFKNYFGLS
jgi:hypothetical protein